MPLPGQSEINVYDMLDERTAVEHFLNKTLEQAQAMFAENGETYQEDLMWMGPVAFAFYLQAAVNYLQSEEAAGDDYFIYCLHSIVVFRLKEKGFSLAIDTVNKLVDYVINNYEKFKIDPVAFGNLLGKYRQLRMLLAEQETN